MMSDFFLIAAIVVGALALMALIEACWYGVSKIARSKAIPVQPSRSRIVLKALARAGETQADPSIRYRDRPRAS